MTDPIFSAALYMDRVWREVQHLCESIEEGLEREGFGLTYCRDYSHKDEPGGHRMASEYRLRRVYPRQKSDAQLILYFDLARTGPATSWPASHSALLLVAYEARYDNGWALDTLAFRTDGTFENSEARASLIPHPDSGNRLLWWDDGDENSPWSRRSWLFGLELSRLDGPEAVDKEVLTPFVGLMKRNLSPLEAFANSNAVSWPDPKGVTER
jgi:hypothetical protein